MNPVKDNLHFGIALIVNMVIVGLVINYVWPSDSDKSIVFFIILYPALTVLNLVIWIILQISRNSQYKIYRWMTIALVVSFIPATIAVSLY